MSKLIFSLDKHTAKKLSNLYRTQKVRRIYQGIYTDNLTDPIEKIVNSHWMQIVTYIVSKGILSFRTAVDIKPTPYKKGLNIIFVTSSYVKTIKLPGLIIKVYKGNYYDYYEQILPNLAKSNVPRMILENLTVVKSKELKGIKTITKSELEKWLARELQFHGEKRLNQIRDEAKEIAINLKYQKEYNSLNQITSALLNTQSITNIKNPYAISVAKSEPYDENRLQTFEKLNLYLQQCLFKERLYSYTKTSYSA